MARKSRGRLRLEMAKIENETNLQVTFSKRRFGLFKKANELVTLCGAEVALIIFSPGQKVFSFGHPSVESIIERFFNLNINSALVDAHRLATICQLTTELNHTEHLFDIQKKQGQILNQRMKNNPNKHCWEAHVDELSPQQLVELKVALEDLKNNVVGVVHKFMVPSANTNPSMLESGLFFGRNVAGYGARFNRTLPHYNSTMSMLPLPRASEASSSSMPWI